MTKCFFYLKQRKKTAISFLTSIVVLFLCISTKVCAAETGAQTAVSAPPAITAESAVLIDVETGTILYSKNPDTKQYPASITKLLTCLIAEESCAMDEVVTFSNNAVFGIERSSSNIGIDVDETLTMEECLYAALLASANEVCVAMAEHISESEDAFAAKMNERAKALGCVNSNFVNPNGLPNDNHYTSAHDMALIGRAFYSNEHLTQISGTATYHISATATQPDEIDIGNHNKMLPGTYYGSKYYYEGLLGGKTGYTNVARQTLVTCAEKDGIRLVCVVMKAESPNQYLDSAALYDYGFSNFHQIKAASVIDDTTLQNELSELTGDGYAIGEIPADENLLVAKKYSAADIEYEISYETGTTTAVIQFLCDQKIIGTLELSLEEIVPAAQNEVAELERAASETESTGEKEEKGSGIWGTLKIAAIIVLILGGIVGLFFWKQYQEAKRLAAKRRAIMERARIRREQQEREALLAEEAEEDFT